MIFKKWIGGVAIVSATLSLCVALSHADCQANWPVSDQTAIAGFCQSNGVTCTSGYQTPLMCHNVDPSTGWNSDACPNPYCDASTCQCACPAPAGTISGFGGATGTCAAWQYQVSQGCDASGNVNWGDCVSSCSAWGNVSCGGSVSSSSNPAIVNGPVNCPAGSYLQESTCADSAANPSTVTVAQCGGSCTAPPPPLAALIYVSPVSSAPYAIGQLITVGASGGTTDNTWPTGGLMTISGDASCSSANGVCVVSLTLTHPGTYTFTATVSSAGYLSGSATTSITVSPMTMSVTANPTIIPLGSQTSQLNIQVTAGGKSPFTYGWAWTGGSPAECQLSSSSVSSSAILTISDPGFQCTYTAAVMDALGNTASGSIAVQSASASPPTVFLGTPEEGYTGNWEALIASSSTAQISLDASVTPTDSNWTVTGVQFQFNCTGSGTFPSSVQGAYIDSNTFTNPVVSYWGATTYAPPGICTVKATATETYTLNTGISSMGTSGMATIHIYLQPIATIISPVSGDVIPDSGPITVNVNSSAPSGQTVTSVTLYDGSQALDSVSGDSGVFSVLLGTGPHTLTANAQDGPPDQYESPLSAPVNLEIVTTLQPSIFITAPLFGARVLAGTPLAFQTAATAVAPHVIQSVAFHAQSDALPNEGLTFAIAYNAPFSTVWNPPTAGLYQFGATVTDSAGLMNDSNWVTVNVDSPPVVSISSPTTNSVIPSGSSVTVNVMAMDPNPGGSIAEVDLYLDSATYIGQAVWVGFSSYTYTWTPGATGTFHLQAKAKDSYGWTTWSSAALVLVSSGGMVAPTITQQPSNAMVTVGQSASFHVGAVGVPTPTYQWQVNTSTGFFNIPGAVNSSYSTTPLPLTDSGWQYQCVISNSGGSVTSAVASLTVIKASALTVTMQAAAPVAVGSPTTFQISAAGGVPPYTYQWQTAPPGSSTWTVVSSATSTSLTFTPSSLSQNGTSFRGQATDSQPGAPNTAFSPAGILSVPALTLQNSPIPITVAAGQVAGFLTIVAYGAPPYHYEWQRSLEMDGNAYADIPGAADSAWYQFTPADGTYNQYNFRDIVTDSAGESVTTATSLLTVIVPAAADDDVNMSFLPIPPLVAGTDNYGSIIQFRNTGYNTWTSTGGYVLALQKPAGSMIWGYNTAALNNGVVLPAGTAGFSLDVPAPTAAGVYPFYWQMQHNGQFFGQIGGQDVIVVSLAAIPDVLSNNAEINFNVGSVASVSLTIFGTDAGTNSASVLSAVRAGSGVASPIASMTLPAGQSLNLASLHLAPGDYVMQIVVTDGNGLKSPPVSKAFTMVGTALDGIRVFPNPWRADQDNGYPVTFDNLSGATTVKIFTVSGRWVCTLPVSNNAVSWNLKNDSGDTVQSGLYLYLITDGQGNKVTGKLAVIR